MNEIKLCEGLVGHCVNVIWSAFWAVFVAWCVYLLLPAYVSITAYDLHMFCLIIGLAVFVVAWLINFVGTKCKW